MTKKAVTLAYQTHASTCYPSSHLVASPQQVFGFSVKRDALMYDQWDWSQLSTVAWNTDPALICKAHQHGAKVVANAELPANRSLLESTSFRASWVRLANTDASKALYKINSLASVPCAQREHRY